MSKPKTVKTEYEPVQFCLRKSDDGKTYTEIGGSGDIWNDLFTAMEGMGMLIRIIEDGGYKEHKGESILNYVKAGVEKAYDAATYLGKMGG